MNTKEHAAEKITAFLKSSDQRVMLLNGTHQNEKHPLVVRSVFANCSKATVLFRVNSMANAGNFLRPVGFSKAPKPGTALNAPNGNRLYVDTINQRSWKSSPNAIDVAVVYPCDSLDADSGSECVEDLRQRGVKKILLVTWTDNRDFSWVDSYNPVRVTYDAEAERAEYHADMKKLEAKVLKSVPVKLPEYAKSAAPEYLVRLHCDKCGSTRWAKLNRPYPGHAVLVNATTGEYEATCLVCGTHADDNYNWFER